MRDSPMSQLYDTYFAINKIDTHLCGVLFHNLENIMLAPSDVIAIFKAIKKLYRDEEHVMVLVDSINTTTLLIHKYKMTNDSISTGYAEIVQFLIDIRELFQEFETHREHVHRCFTIFQSICNDIDCMKQPENPIRYQRFLSDSIRGFRKYTLRYDNPYYVHVLNITRIPKSQPMSRLRGITLRGLDESDFKIPAIVEYITDQMLVAYPDSIKLAY